MVSVFGDDSADETKERVFAIGGVLATEEEWTRIEEQWTAKCEGIPFHATDCDSNRGQYAGRRHEENKQLYKELVQLLVNSNAWGFGAALDIAGFTAWYPDVPGELSYYKALYETIGRLAYVARDVFKDEVKFTFDSRVQSNFTAGLIYESMLNNSAGDAPQLVNKLTFASARTNARIQVGDLYAREVMKELDNRIGPKKRPRRHSMAALVETKRFGCDLLLADYFEDMRRKTAELETKDDEFNRRYRAWLEASRLPDTIFYKGCGEEGNGPGCGGGGGGCNPDLMDCGSSGGSPSDPSAGSSGFCDASGDCSGIYDSSDNGGQGGYVGGVSGNSNPIGATSPLDEFNAGVARYLSIMRTGWDPELQVQYYEYSFAGGDGTTLEKQKELAAIQLGETKCAGQDPSTVASCIQQAYNTMGIATDKDGKPLLVGGNYNFNYSTVSINGEGIDPKQLGCATLGQQTRCGVIDSLHFHDGTGTFHVDTGNAWFFPVGTMAHFGWDIIGGNTVWRQGGIPRPWWQ